jgi:hypothetical protein
MEPLDIEDGAFYKVVQLYIGDEPIIGLGDVHKKHSQILEALLTERKLPFTSNKNKPRIEGTGYKVVGMGHMSRDAEHILLHSVSIDYGIGIDPVHARRLQELGAFNKYQVEIKQYAL